MKIIIDVELKKALDIAKQIEEIKGVNYIKMKYNTKQSKLL